MFGKIAQGRTAESVVIQIESLILEGVLRVGDRLPAERDLSEQMGISRPILREALKDMQERGILQSSPGGGTFVADIIGEVFSPQMTDLFSHHMKAKSDYLDYRREVDALSAQWACERATDDDREILTNIMDSMIEAAKHDDVEAEAELDVNINNIIRV